MERLKWWVVGIVVASVIGLAVWRGPGVVVIHAQSLPVTKTLAWDANPASEQVTSYTVRLDGTTIGTPTTPSQSFTIATAGTHTFTVTATNLWGTSAPATLTVNVVIPSSVQNPRVQ